MTDLAKMFRCGLNKYTKLTESLGVEHLPQVVRRKRVDSEDALIRKAPLAAGYKNSQELPIC